MADHTEERALFHRTANHRTQTIGIAVKQNRSGEIWGRGAFGGLPAALAHLGEIPDIDDGTEFVTSIPYAKNGDPAWAYWYLPQHGGDQRVRLRTQNAKDYACIEIEPIRNRYRCKQK